MSQFEIRSYSGSSGGQAAVSEYVFDMIGQLAELARAAGELQAAIFLEAILLARLAANEERAP